MARPVEIFTDQDKAAFRQEYQTALETLIAIRDASPLPDAQVKPALQYMARVLVLVLRLLVRIYNNR